jgi:hypothetical protein
MHNLTLGDVIRFRYGITTEFTGEIFGVLQCRIIGGSKIPGPWYWVDCHFGQVLVHDNAVTELYA